MANHDGGAIYVNGTDAHISADFTNCVASSIETPNIKGNGGAIYVNGTNADIHDATFKNCTALNDGNGGAIYVAGINTVVESSKFENTSTTYNGLGGAIYIEGEKAHVITSDFNNTHARDGGAIYIYGVNAIVSDSTFENTLAGSGIEWIYDGNGNVIGFKEAIKGDGGAIYIYGVNATIENASIISSSATHKGGAVYVEGDEATISVTLYDSHAGISESSNIVPSSFNNNIVVINNNINSMINRVNNNVIISKDDLNSLSSNINNVKNKIDSIFVNTEFNQDNYDAVNAAVSALYSSLNSYVAMGSDVGNSLMPYYENIRKDLDNISLNKNYAEFNNPLKNNIKNNLTSMISYINYVLDLNKTLYEIKDGAGKIFNNPVDYNSVNNRIIQLNQKTYAVSNDINMLDQYGSQLTDIATNNSIVQTQLIDIQYRINNLHDNISWKLYSI